MQVAADIHINPFKGLASYEEKDKDIFFGRSDGTAELSRLVRLNALTLVYGKSGIGKSSLLKAGLQPQLREENYFPVWIRYPFNGNPDEVYHYIIKECFEAEARVHDISIEPAGEIESKTLWEYFHQKTFWNAYNVPQIPVLIFDQFEELYKKGAGSKEALLLIEQLCDLAANFIPASIIKGKKETTSSQFTKPAKPYDAKAQNYRMVFSFREDDLVIMEEELRSFPQHLLRSCRFRLNPMTFEGAHEAIERPDPDLVERGGVEMIINYLAEKETKLSTRREEGIEPAMMSLICTELFKEKQQTGAPIKLSSLNKQRFDAILENFYTQTLSGKGEEVKKYIENELIDEKGNRQHKILEDIKSVACRQDIDKLVEDKLLRKVDYGGILFVELIHDKLTSIVKQHRDTRRKEEFDARLKAEAQEKKLKEQQLRKQKFKQNAGIAGIIVILSLTALAMALYLIEKKSSAEKERQLQVLNKQVEDHQQEINALVGQREEILKSRNATIEQIRKASEDSIRNMNASEAEKLQAEVKLLTLRNQKASEDIKLLQNDLTRQKNDYEIKLKQLSSQNQYNNNTVQEPNYQSSNIDTEQLMKQVQDIRYFIQNDRELLYSKGGKELMYKVDQIYNTLRGPSKSRY